MVLVLSTAGVNAVVVMLYLALYKHLVQLNQILTKWLHAVPPAQTACTVCVDKLHEMISYVQLCTLNCRAAQLMRPAAGIG